MSRTSKALKRLGVAGIAVATIGAGVPALVASSAQAATGGTTTQLVIAPLSQTGAAGTCLLYTVTPLNSTGEQPGDTPTITVQLTENPVSDTQDVDFCTVAGTTTTRGTTTATGAAVYQNGNAIPTQQTYTPGTTNNSPAAANVAPGNNPDSASGASNSTATNTNPSGTDSQRFQGANDGSTSPTVTNPNNGSIVFGVVGATAGGANITAFIDNGAGAGGVVGDYVRQPGETKANQDAAATFTAGNSPEAVTVVDAEPKTGSAPINSTITYTVTLKNSSGQTVAGVSPTAVITAGPDAAQPASGSTPAQAAQPVTCGTTDNTGTTTCSYTTRSTTGTDTIVTYVNKACGTSIAFDSSCEPSDQITRTVAPATSAARNLALTPRDATTVAGQTRIFEAKVTDVNGTPVPDVEVQFSETGAGRFVDGTPNQFGNSYFTTATGADGIARATVTSAASETGTQEVYAAITGVGTRDASGKFTKTVGSTDATTQCNQAKGTGTGATSSTKAGNCSDATTNTFVLASSPSATPTSSTSPAPGCTGSQSNLPVRVNTPTINATGLASVTITGAPAGATIEVQGYSQNHYMTANFANDPTPVDRVVTADSNGAATISDLRPASNTRLRARVRGCTFTGLGSVINVRAQETLQVSRVGTRRYTISGKSIPARPGGLIINIYCDKCSPSLIAQPRAGSTNGLYSYTITFPRSLANQRVNLQARTGQDAQNAPGASNIRNLLVY